MRRLCRCLRRRLDGDKLLTYSGWRQRPPWFGRLTIRHYCIQHNTRLSGTIRRFAVELLFGAKEMRTLLSRVEDVFQIADRGCVVAPGIPRSSDACIKVGDRLWLTRPDGSEANTLVRGIEMGGRNPDAGIPILLGSELTKDDIPVGTLLAVEFAPTETVVIRAESEQQLVELETLFITEDRQLRLGWSSRSRRRDVTLTDLQSGDVEFIDYVMEGFVPYHINASVRGHTLTLTISLHGSNRDEYIEPQIRHYLRQAGLTVTSAEHRTIA